MSESQLLSVPEGLPEFVFVTCQVGAEQALRREVGRRFPQWRGAFARKGLVTFKIPLEDRPTLWLHPPELILARAWGFSWGVYRVEDLEQLRPTVVELVNRFGCKGLHVWSRDRAEPGHFDYEPAVTALDIECAKTLRQMLAPRVLKTWVGPGVVVLDVMQVDPGVWLLGVHRTTDCPTSRWPGGLSRVRLPEDAVSRAYLKMEEALRWSALPIRSGQWCAELGAAPGGSSQALLRRGLRVLGIDPAQVHPTVANHPHFVHIRRKARYVKRRIFRRVRWLFADMNVTPNYTLDVVEDIVTRPDVNIWGMLLTLKLTDWKLVDQAPRYIRRVQSWGYPVVRMRQLHHHRRELCLMAAVAPVEQLARRSRPRRTKDAPCPRRPSQTKASSASDSSAQDCVVP